MRVSEATSSAITTRIFGRTRRQAGSTAFQILVFVGLILTLVASAAVAGTGDRPVQLRSGVIEPNREAPDASSGESDGGPKRFVVRFRQAQGWFEKGALETAGARVETALPGQAYLVTVPAGRAVPFEQIPGVDWATPYLAQDKISPEIAAVKSVEEGDEADVIVLLHLFRDAAAKRVAAELAEAGLRVEGAKGGSRFGRVVMRMTPAEVETHRADLAARDDVFWIERRHRRVLTNDRGIWLGQSGMFGGEATPVFDRGIHGEGQVAAILDTGLDIDMCYFRDGALGLPPINDGSTTTVDLNQRKVIAVNFLDPAENPADPTHWDTQNHGTHVAGILAGDDLANPIDHDEGDGMAPGAKLVIQDAGYAADDCGDLPALGCPVTDLTPIFQQAYDQGARAHNNSWNDNENASVQNIYTDASQDVDEFIWSHPDFLIVFGAGNQGYPAGQYGKIGSPGTAKNGMSVGATYYGEYAQNLADISSWGYTDDGRIKPDVVFQGQSIFSASNDMDITTDNCGTRGMGGTSMASPGVVGHALLVRQYFMEGWYPTGSKVPANGFTPTAALVKAALVNSAVPIQWDNGGQPTTIPSEPQGWGRILLDNALHFSGDSRGLWVDEHAGFTGPGDSEVLYMLEMEDTGEPLKITLAWTDYPSTPAASTHLVNDLDLQVDGASGGFVGNNWSHGASLHGGEHDRLNNLEQVLIEDPLPGLYAIRVKPHAVPSGPQSYALVISGGRFSVSGGPSPSYLSHVLDDSGGNGDGVLDPGETARIPITLWNAGDAAATSVLGQLYSAYPDLLKVYDATSSYADMAVGGQASSTSPHYEVTLEPSASCGQVLGAHMGITGDGFESGTAFALEIGVYDSNLASPDTPKSIPRSSTAGVSSYIDVPSTFPLTEVDVTVNIDHSNIGDLDVLLYPPTVTGAPPIFLHNNSGDGVSGIHTTYDELTAVDGPGLMEDLVGLDPQGTWRIKVTNAGNKTGTFENWTLHLKSDIPFSCNPVGCGQGVPSPVGNTLTVAKSGGSGVTVGWTSVGSSNYNVWRSSDPALFNAVHVGSTSSTSLVDSGAQNLPGVHYYVVRSVNSCRWESE